MHLKLVPMPRLRLHVRGGCGARLLLRRRQWGLALHPCCHLPVRDVCDGKHLLRKSCRAVACQRRELWGLELRLLWSWARRSARIAPVLLFAMLRLVVVVVVVRWAMRSDKDK